MLWIYPSKRSRFLSYRVHMTPDIDFWLVKIFLEWCSWWFPWVLWDFRKSAQNDDRMIKTLKCFPSSNHSKNSKICSKNDGEQSRSKYFENSSSCSCNDCAMKIFAWQKQLGVWLHAWLGMRLNAWLGMGPHGSGLFLMLRPRFLPVSLRVPRY